MNYATKFHSYRWTSLINQLHEKFTWTPPPVSRQTIFRSLPKLHHCWGCHTLTEYGEQSKYDPHGRHVVASCAAKGLLRQSARAARPPSGGDESSRPPARWRYRRIRLTAYKNSDECNFMLNIHHHSFPLFKRGRWALEFYISLNIRQRYGLKIPYMKEIILYQTRNWQNKCWFDFA